MSRTRDALESFSSAIRKLREVGFLYAVSLFLQRLIPAQIFSMTSIVVMQLATRNAALAAPIGRWATLDDVPALTQFGHPAHVIQERLERGDRAWIVVRGDLLLSYCWFTEGPYHDEVSGLDFPARSNEVWLYDAMVNRANRGQGIYPSVLSSAALRLRDEGVFGIWIVVEVLNHNSIRAHEGGGAVVKQKVQVLSLLGRRMSRHSAVG